MSHHDTPRQNPPSSTVPAGHAKDAPAKALLTFAIPELSSTPKVLHEQLPNTWVAERMAGLYEAIEPALDVRASATKVAEVVEVHAHVHGRFGFQCSRCAEPAELTVDTEFTHHFVGPGQLDAGDDPDEVDDLDADPDVSEHDGLRIVLDDLAIEYTILALPDVPLCSEDCKGLCPVCGTNRNVETCTCAQTAPEDSPWAALRGLNLPAEPD